MKYAELTEHGIIRYIGESAFIPELAAPMRAVDVTGTDAKEGDCWDGEKAVPLTLEIANAVFRKDFNAERDRLFAATAWARERHADQVELGIDDTSNWTAWLNYWQALRNLPDMPGFDASNPDLPEMPE